MSITNHVQLIGRLGSNPKFITTDQTQKILTVSLATNDHFKDSKGVKQTRTEWHNLIAFNGLADILNEHCKKGSFLLVIGKLQTRQYIDKNQVSRYVTEIVLEKIQMLGDKSQAQGGEN